MHDPAQVSLEGLRMMIPVDAALHRYETTVTDSLLDQTAQLMNERSGRSLGVAFVLALRTVMDWGCLPGGAVMVHHACTWFTPVEAGQHVVTELSIRRHGSSSRSYQEVTIGYYSHVAGARLIDQEQTVLWPQNH